MTTPLVCLLLFALWTVGLVLFGIGLWRVVQVLLHGARPNAFPAGTPHGPEWYQRLQRAHMNCVENLPIFGAVVLAGAVAGVRDPTFDLLAQVYLGARVGQTITHVASGRSLVVNIRFTFFLVQLGAVIAMAGKLLATV